jgi:hypothetical protein
MNRQLLPELMVAGELAQAAAEERTDVGLDELAPWFAARFVDVASGHRRGAPSPRHLAAPRAESPPNRGHASSIAVPSA